MNNVLTNSLSPADYVSAERLRDALNAFFAENHSLIRIGGVDYATAAHDESDPERKQTDIVMQCAVTTPPDLVGTRSVTIFIGKNGDRAQLQRAWVSIPYPDIPFEGDLLSWLNAMMAAKGQAITITDVDMSEYFPGEGDWAARRCRVDPGPVRDQILGYYNNIVMYSLAEGRMDVRYVGLPTEIDLETARPTPVEGVVWQGLRYAK